MITALRQYLAYRALRRARAAQARCCGGHCTTADDARALAQLAPLPLPIYRQRRPKES